MSLKIIFPKLLPVNVYLVLLFSGYVSGSESDSSSSTDSGLTDHTFHMEDHSDHESVASFLTTGSSRMSRENTPALLDELHDLRQATPLREMTPFMEGNSKYGCHFADDIFSCIFLNENDCTSVQNSLKFVSEGPIDKFSIGLGKGIVLNRQQAIIWSNVDLYLGHHMASLKFND